MDAEITRTEPLTAHECWALLREAPVGRLALSPHGEPDIFPINFVVDQGTIVFRTAEGTKSQAAERARAAFEADGTLDDGSRVWSVVVKGRTASIATTSELLDTVRLPLHPWEQGRKDRFMRLVPETITGRAFAPAPPPPHHRTAQAHDE